MRASLALPLALLAACAPGDVNGALSWRSTLDARTKGVGLHRDGSIGHAAMFGTNCPFDTTHGQVTGDQQLPGSGEALTDVGTSWLGPNSVLLVLDDTVYVLDKTTGVYVQDQFPAPGVVDARFADTGPVLFVDGGPGGCRIAWTDPDHAITSRVRMGDTCPADATFDVEPATGRAALQSPTGLEVLDSDGSTLATADVPGDLVTWDPDASAIDVATAGEDTVTALEEDGTLRWTAIVDGPVQAITKLGTPGGVAVSVEHEDGTGELVVLDPDTGGVLASVRTPTAAESLNTSRDGSTIAMVTPEHVHFYVWRR